LTSGSIASRTPRRRNGHRLVGDVNFRQAVEVGEHDHAGAGGVGPLTIALLMRNTVQAARQAS